MSQFAKAFVSVVTVATVFLAAFVFPVAADVELTDVNWQTVGTQVHFNLRFHNPDVTNPSGDVSGTLSSQPFGAFLPNNGTIGNFNVPPLAPDSFFDVFFDISLTDLPPSAERITPTSGGGGLASAPLPCPPDLFWAGNVDVNWSGPGGSGQVGYHFGTLQICPGGQTSYIHVLVDCTDVLGASWSFGPLCPGWSATLVSSDGVGMPNGPASNPLPGGPFEGWICVSADSSVAVGSTCCFDLNITCAGVTVPINVCAEACIWEPVANEPSSWGKIKSLYQD